MSNAEEQLANTGFAILILLTIIMGLLKAIGYIGISWWWVLSPILIPCVAVIVFFIGFLTLAFITGRGKDWDEDE